MIRLINGNCLDEIKNLPNESVDSVVTDPPYGISFMGKKWDYDVPSVELWKEVMRVMKPGAHALVACGTRTQHRMAVNLEDAGFEIRDLIAWVYGSGFPKSLDVGKAIDKLQGNEREFVRTVKRTGKSGGTYGEFKGNNTETKGNTEWEGWGTALKPSMELWTLVRKPLEEKTVAENVLKHGTGGINIDGCRIKTTENLSGGSGRVGGFAGKTGGGELSDYRVEGNADGRFPANFIHDGSEEVEALFPQNRPGMSGGGTGRRDNSMFGIGGVSKPMHIRGDSGSASRFFYCAKASTKERNEGLEGKNVHPTVKPISLMRYLVRLVTPKGGVVMDPFCGSGTTGVACREEGFGFIGMEREKEYIEIARNRIGDVLEKS